MLLIAILASFCTSASSSSNIRPPPGLQAPPDWEYVAMPQAPLFEYMPQVPDFGHMPQAPVFGHMPQAQLFGYMPQASSAPPGIPHFLHEEAHARAMQSYQQEYQHVVEDGLRRLQKMRKTSAPSNTPLPNLSQPMRVGITPSMLENQPTGAETPLVSENPPIVEIPIIPNAQPLLPRLEEDVPPATMPNRDFFWPIDIRKFSSSEKQIVSPFFESQGKKFKAMILPPLTKDERKGKNSLKSAQGKFRIQVKCEQEPPKGVDPKASFIILVERRTINGHGWEEMNQASTLDMDVSLRITEGLDEIFDLNMEGTKSMRVGISIHQA